jgi:hypothetical protein
MAAFRWIDGRILAAKLLWEGRLTGVQIAAPRGVCRQALDKWKAKTEFRARLRQYAEEVRACCRQQMKIEWARKLDEPVRDEAIRLDLRTGHRRQTR